MYIAFDVAFPPELSLVTRTDRRWVAMQILVIVAIVLALIILKPPEERLIPIWVGVALCIISLVLFISSFVAHTMVNRTIQVNVCPSPDSKKRLVVRGIYAYVRHPMYLAAILLLLGAAIWRGNLVVLGYVVLAVVFVYLKARYEERLLLQIYSDYAAYMKRTGRLLPKLWW